MNDHYRDPLVSPKEYLESFIGYYENTIKKYDAEHMVLPYEATKAIYKSMNNADVDNLKLIFQRHKENAEELGSGFHQIIMFLGRYIEQQNSNT